MRCEIAGSLLHAPEVLLLDEPTIGLDVVAKQRIREHIREVNSADGTTVFLTSHDAGDVERLCQRALIIDHGALVFDDSVTALKRRFLGVLEYGEVESPEGVGLHRRVSLVLKLRPTCGRMNRNVFVVCAFVGAMVLTACSSSGSQAPTAAPAAATPKPAAAASSPSPVAAVSPAAVVSPSAVSSPSPATATALPAPSTPSPTAASPATPTAVTAEVTVWVAGTEGGGVYLRNSPHDGDRAGVIAENTPLTVTGDLEEGDGQNWYPVKTPDGTTGYVSKTYTTMNDPKAAPLPLVPDQAK